MWGFRTGRTYVRRRSSYSAQTDRKFLGGILYLFFFVVLYFWAHNEHTEREMRLAFDEVRSEIVETKDTVNYYNSGKLIHFTTSSTKPSDILVDPEFQLSGPQRTIKMKRVEEYCQWIEIATHHSEKDDEGNTVEWTTYHYTKEWVSSPILSTFYDQPFAHHNPLRQPFPNRYWQTEKLEAGGYSLNSDIISSLNTYRTHELSNWEINNFIGSIAYAEKFAYIGQGYFYSAYEPSGATLAAKLFGGFLEGSLLDYQLVDFFPQCTAGDVRVHFEVAAPNSVSVIGKQLDESGSVGVYVTSRGFNVGYLKSEILSFGEILDRELSDQHWTVLLLRGLLSLFIYFLVCFHSPLSWPNLSVFCFAVSLTVSLFAGLFLILYPFSLLSLLAVTFGSIGMYFIGLPIFFEVSHVDNRKNM